LIIRTTGDESRIDISLENNFLHVNRDSFGALALEIDRSQYSQILLLSGGEDVVRISGDNLVGQMHPNSLWVSAPVASDASAQFPNLQIHGSNFEHVEMNDSHFQDAGPFIHRSNNRIRMYGDAGVDRLNMRSSSGFAIATSVSMAGEGYFFSANVFGDLFVSGGGGDDFASLVGTRGFEENSFVLSESTTGNDIYFGSDNLSRISNELWDGRFVDFETQRIDLLSGADRASVSDSQQNDTYYRVDGEHLVGAFRRMIGIESIDIDGAGTGVDSLTRPDLSSGQFSEEADQFRYSFEAAEHTEDRDVVTSPPPVGDVFAVTPEIIPADFSWTFSSFEQLL